MLLLNTLSWSSLACWVVPGMHYCAAALAGGLADRQNPSTALPAAFADAALKHLW
jgi:hypothetical protein